MLRGMWGFRSGARTSDDGCDVLDQGSDYDEGASYDEGARGAADVNIPGTILRCRRSADLSQRDLAALLGVCPSTVARWESGSRMPGADMLVAIADIAGYRLGLIDADDHPVAVAPSDTLRDLGGRRMPAHLDVHLWDEDLWEPRPSDRKVVRSIHAPRRRARDWRRAALTGRVVARAPGCAPFHTLGRSRWCHDVTTPADYIHWRAAQQAWRDAHDAEVRARTGPLPQPEPCFCPDECFESPVCLPECRCQCESYSVVVA